MTKTLKFALGTVLAAALASQPAFAQQKKPAAAAPAPAAGAQRTPVAPGVAVADLEAAVGSTNAYRNAQAQRQTYFKPALDAAQAKFDQYEAQLKPLRAQLNADVQAKKPDSVLQQEYVQIQKLEAQRDNDAKQALAPVQLSEAYVQEQITDKLPQALQNTVSKRGISLLLNPDAVILSAPVYDATATIVAELNVLVPSVQIVPPQGWMPRRVREQQAAQQQAAQAPAGAPATAPKPAGPQPEGR